MKLVLSGEVGFHIAACDGKTSIPGSRLSMCPKPQGMDDRCGPVQQSASDASLGEPKWSPGAPTADRAELLRSRKGWHFAVWTVLEHKKGGPHPTEECNV